MNSFARFSAVLTMISCAIGGVVLLVLGFQALKVSFFVTLLYLFLALTVFSSLAYTYAVAFEMPAQIEELERKIGTQRQEISSLRNEVRNDSAPLPSSGLKPVSSTASLQGKKKTSKIAEEAWRCPGCGSVNLGTRLDCFGCGKTRPVQKTSAEEQTDAEKYWTCVKCGKSNLSSRDTCWSCGKKK